MTSETEPYSTEWFNKLGFTTLYILVVARILLGDTRNLIDGIITYISMYSYDSLCMSRIPS